MTQVNHTLFKHFNRVPCQIEHAFVVPDFGVEVYFLIFCLLFLRWTSGLNNSCIEEIIDYLFIALSLFYMLVHFQYVYWKNERCSSYLRSVVIQQFLINVWIDYYLNGSLAYLCILWVAQDLEVYLQELKDTREVEVKCKLQKNFLLHNDDIFVRDSLPL